MDTGLTSDYIRALQDEAKVFGTSVMAGKCSSFDQYKYQVGYIQGLQKAEHLLHQIIEDALRAQDLD